MALAWQADQRLRHKACGHYLDESMDKANVRAYEAEQMTCAACMVIDLRRKALADQESDTAGLQIYAVRRQGHGR